MKYVAPLACLWFVFLSVAVVGSPEWVGSWQARAELSFYEEAERIGMWVE